MTGGALTNHGSIIAGNGAAAVGGSTASAYPGSGSGGNGVYISHYSASVQDLTIVNYGLIAAGAAGNFNGSSGTAAPGGIGLCLGAGTASNHGTITGGTGGYTGQNDESGNGGIGGAGAVVAGTAKLTNAGTIIGGAGGAVLAAGTTGGAGVLVEGGTFIDSGVVKGGVGGQNGAQGDAVYLFGTVAGTLEVNPGASFSGLVIANAAAANVLEFGGTSTTTLSGIGTEFSGFSSLSFASGAQRIVEGSIAAFTGVAGFAAHDAIVLDGYTADLSETFIEGPYIYLSEGTSYTALDIPHGLAKDLILTDGNGKTTLTAAVGTLARTLSSSAEQFVLSGGLATGTTLNAGSHAEIYNGGTAASFKLAGGTLELNIGAKVTGGIGFTSVKGGELILDSATMPTATISGFIAGDSIKLAGVAYNSHDTVTVKTAGIVSIVAPGITYNLNVAGATVGETGFKFSAGSVLTSAATAASVMAFLSPKDALYTPGHTPMDIMLPHAILTGHALATEAHLAPIAAPQPAAAPLPPVLAAYLGGHVMTLSNHAPLTVIDLTHHL